MKLPKITIKRLMILVAFTAFAIWLFKDVRYTHIGPTMNKPPYYNTYTIGGSQYETIVTIVAFGDWWHKLIFSFEGKKVKSFAEQLSPHYIHSHTNYINQSPEGNDNDIYIIHYNIFRIEVL